MLAVYLIGSGIFAVAMGIMLTTMNDFKEMPIEGQSQLIGAGSIMAFVWPATILVGLGMLLGKLKP